MGKLQRKRLLFERSCPRSGPRIVPTSRRRHSLPAVLPAIAMAAVYGNPTEFSCFPLPIQKTAFGRTLRLSKKTLGRLGSARKTVNPPHYGGLFFACSENLLEVNGFRSRAERPQGIATLAAQWGVATLTEGRNTTFPVKQLSAVAREYGSARWAILPTGKYGYTPFAPKGIYNRPINSVFTVQKLNHPHLIQVIAQILTRSIDSALSYYIVQSQV